MIDKIKNAELKERKEDLLKNMRMLRHTVADMLGSKSFLRGLAPGAQNGVITVYGEQFPIYITANTLAADGLPEITEDIYDEENYLSLISDDDLMWYALVEHLAHQTELLQNENNQLREELTAADNEINELEETLKEVNKKCSEYVSDIDKLEVDNKRLSERVKTLVIEKTNRDDVAEKVSDPKDKYLDMDTLQLLTKITELENENEKLEERLKTLVCKECIYSKDLPLNTRIAQLEEKLKSTETELTTAMNANVILKTQIAALKNEKKEAELLAYRLIRGEMRVQFDSMESLEHENTVLKHENADLNQKLCQKVMHATYSAHGEEPEDDLKKKIAEYDQKYNEVLDYNKKLRQEITALRIDSGLSVADDVDNEDMQQTITQETMAELTAKINELEIMLKDKDERINQMSKNNAALSVENKNINDLLKNADRDAKFYAREVDHLRKENDRIYSILNDAVKVVRERNKQQ